MTLSLPQAEQIFSVTEHKVDYVSELQECEEVLQSIEDLTDCINFILRALVSNSASGFAVGGRKDFRAIVHGTSIYT